jgi:hypothetical protein
VCQSAGAWLVAAAVFICFADGGIPGGGLDARRLTPVVVDGVLGWLVLVVGGAAT